MRRLLAGAAGLLALLLAVAVIRTLSLESAPKAPAAAAPFAVDADAAARRLAGALRIPTVTHNERSKVDWSQFPALHAYLEKQFPRVHAALKRETVAQYSLLYTWPGSDAAAAPILLLAHQDVVPIEPGTEGQWEQPPFGGAIADGYVWGRGALDDKCSLLAQLEAVEGLLAAGFVPRRTIYLAFGHDEEIGGREGAKEIAALLEQRKVRAEFSLDEGGQVTVGIVGGVPGPVASVMTAEKGYVSFYLTARDAGGHSSRPPAVTAVGRLARAVARLQARRLDAQLVAPVTDMLDRLAPAMPWPQRLIVSNRWLFGSLLVRDMQREPVTNAMVRTTTAPTMFNAGIKENVLPAEARAVVNFRVLPGETVDGLETRVRAIIDDAEVEIARGDFQSDPSPVSPTATPSFALLERTVNEVFPEAVVAPGVVIGGTDNRHYGAVREYRYNFLPVTLVASDLGRYHGHNERVAIEAHARAVVFYSRLLLNANRP